MDHSKPMYRRVSFADPLCTIKLYTPDRDDTENYQSPNVTPTQRIASSVLKCPVVRSSSPVALLSSENIRPTSANFRSSSPDDTRPSENINEHSSASLNLLDRDDTQTYHSSNATPIHKIECSVLKCRTVRSSSPVELISSYQENIRPSSPLNFRSCTPQNARPSENIKEKSSLYAPDIGGTETYHSPNVAPLQGIESSVLKCRIVRSPSPLAVLSSYEENIRPMSPFNFWSSSPDDVRPSKYIKEKSCANLYSQDRDDTQKCLAPNVTQIQRIVSSVVNCPPVRSSLPVTLLSSNQDNIRSTSPINFRPSFHDDLRAPEKIKEKIIASHSDASANGITNNEAPLLRDQNFNVLSSDPDISSLSIKEAAPFGTVRMRLADFIDRDRSYLLAKSISNSHVRISLNRPLGVTYDETLKLWIVADTGNHRICCIPEGTYIPGGRCITQIPLPDGRCINQIRPNTNPMFCMPSAVVVYKEGLEFAVLDNFSIRVFNFTTSSFRLIAHVAKARGLAVTLRGNLIVMQRHSRTQIWHVVVYDGLTIDGVITDVKFDGGHSPSFIDYLHHRVIVTDLSEQTLSVFKLDEDANEIHEIYCRSYKQVGFEMKEGCFKYVSGVQFDDQGLALIADADNHSLQLFTPDGIFLHRISFTEEMPYTSNFWVNRDGIMAICARLPPGSLHFYKLCGNDTKLPHVKPSGNRY